MAYTSDFTQFINQWLEQHPEEREEQQKGRSLWWDKPQSPENQKIRAESRVAQKPYPYQAD